MMNYIHTPLSILVIAATISACAPNATAQPREPLDLVPAESLLCLHGQPDTELLEEREQKSALRTLLELGTHMASGQFDARTQLWLRGAEMFNLAIRYPHAFVLIDAAAQPVEQDQRARRVDRLQCAVIAKLDGPATPFLRIVQKTVNDQSTTATATLVSKRHAGWSYQELRDERLPDWAVLAWGEIDGHFVLTLGDGVWPTIANVAAGRAESMSREPWFANVRKDWGRRAAVEIFVAAEAIRKRLDPLIHNRATDFLRVWNVENVPHAHWALGLVDRAMFCVAHFRPAGDGPPIQRKYADPHNREQRLLQTIPPETRYAIYDVPVGQVVGQFFESLLVVQDPKPRENIERIWNNLQARHNFDAQRDLLGHLGDNVVFHNYPPHPLRIPLALTCLLPIRDNPEQVRQTTGRMCTAFQAAIDEARSKGKSPPPWQFRHDDDGVWYVKVGPVAGPAFLVTDKFVIVSWSPHALRTYLREIPQLLDSKRKRGS